MHTIDRITSSKVNRAHDAPASIRVSLSLARLQLTRGNVLQKRSIPHRFQARGRYRGYLVGIGIACIARQRSLRLSRELYARFVSSNLKVLVPAGTSYHPDLCRQKYWESYKFYKSA